jgi:hypothetical protein
MWVFGGSITSSKFCMNIAAAKNATAQRLRAGVGEVVAHVRGQHEHAATSDGAFAMRSSPEPAMMYWVSSVASVCQPRWPPGSIS